MPVVQIDPGALNAGRPISPIPIERQLETKQVVRDFLAQENVVFNAAEATADFFFNDFIEDDNYVPEDDMVGFEGYADELRGARNREEMIVFKNRIREEQERDMNFAAGSPLQKAAAIGALLATDPTTAIPIGGAAYKTYRTSGRILEGGLRTAGIATAIESGREAVLQNTQATRTFEQGATNIAAASVIGGLLGSAAAGLSPQRLDDLATRYGDEMITPTETVDIGTGLSSVGAAQPGTTAFEEEIKGLKRTQKAFDKIPGFLKNPVWETATSASKTVRETSEKLADLSLVKNKNTAFIPSEQAVELLVRSYDALRVPFYKDINTNWAAYRRRVIHAKKTGKALPKEELMGSKKDGTLTYKEFLEQAGRASRRGDEHTIPEVQAVAKSARTHVYDPVLKRSQETGIFDDIDDLDVKTADSWFRRMYNVDKIQLERPRFKEIVINHLRRQRAQSRETLEQFRARFADDIKQGDAQTATELRKLEIRADKLDVEIDDTAEQIIDRITNATQGRLPYDNKLTPKGGFKREPGVRGSAKARVFNIPDEEIEDFLHSDIIAVTESHLRTAAPDNELMGKFGTLDFDIVKKQIQEDYNRMRNTAKAKGDPKAQAKLNAAMNRDIKNTQAMWEKIRGTYAQPDDYAAPAHVMERTALALNFTRLLGDVVASSVPDTMRHVMVHGINRTYGKLFKTLAQDFKGLKFAANEMEEVGLALDMTNSMTALRRANMDEYTPVTGKIDEISQKTAQGFANLTGINIWNATQRTFAGIMTQDRFLEGVTQFAETGKLAKKEIENLASHGIGRSEAKAIAAQFKKYGQKRKTLNIANAREWDDAAARNIFRAAIRKQVDEIIVNPGLERPLWMSKPGWRTIGQFKSFSFSSMQRVALAGIQQADANILAGTTAAVFVGSLVYGWKNTLAGRPVSDDPRVWITEGIDRSGITGWVFDANNIIEKATRGRIGVNALTGGPPMSRYASRNVTGALLGPSFGMAQDMFQVTGAAASGDFKASDTHAARRLFPGQNIPYIRGVYDRLESGFNDTFNVE